MSDAAQAPQGNTGDIINWPMLKIHYRTDPEAIAALLPPGITVGSEPNVNLTVYNFPVPDVPEYGVVTTVNADFDGIQGSTPWATASTRSPPFLSARRPTASPNIPLKSTTTASAPWSGRAAPQGYTFLEFQGISEGRQSRNLNSNRTNGGSRYPGPSMGGPATGYFPPRGARAQ